MTENFNERVEDFTPFDSEKADNDSQLQEEFTDMAMYHEVSAKFRRKRLHGLWINENKCY